MQKKSFREKGKERADPYIGGKNNSLVDAENGGEHRRKKTEREGKRGKASVSSAETSKKRKPAI